MKPDQFKKIIKKLDESYKGECLAARNSWTEILVNLFNRVPLGEKETIQANDFYKPDRDPDKRDMLIQVFDYIDHADLLKDRRIKFVNHSTASFEIYIESIVKIKITNNK